MATRSIIGRSTGNGTFTGVYHHWDGNPGNLGKTLFTMYSQQFKGSLSTMLTDLIDAHPAGYSTINGTSFHLKAGYRHDAPYYKKPDGSRDYDKGYKPHGPRCLCHITKGENREPSKPMPVTERDNVGQEWAYAFDVLDGEDVMYVYLPEYYDRKIKYQRVATVKLKGPEPTWATIECGENLERCCHMAWYHFPELRGTVMERLSVREVLGKQKLDPERDAYAYVYKGVTYLTSGGGSAGTDDKNRSIWFASLTEESPRSPFHCRFYSHFGGRRMQSDYLPVVIRGEDGKKSRMYPGVKALYPPTLKNPLAFMKALSAGRVTASDEKAPAQTEVTPLLLALLGNRRTFRAE